MNSNHTQNGLVFGSCDDMPFELVLLHLKVVGGVLEG